MTEEEANVMRCCGPVGCGGNSSGGIERYCIASKCMAWRTDGGGSQKFDVTPQTRASWERAGWVFAENGLSATLPRKRFLWSSRKS